MVWTDGGSSFFLHDAVILKSYFHLMTRKENGFRLTCGGQDDAKLALSHFHLRTSIGLNSQRACAIIPAKMCPGRNVFLVVERHSIVIVQSEGAVRTWKNIECRRLL